MNSELTIILAIVGVLQGANFWFLSSVKTKLDKLSNGCFTRHIELAKNEGKNEMVLNALHRRIDDLHDEQIK